MSFWSPDSSWHRRGSANQFAGARTRVFLTGAGKYADDVSLPGQAILGVTAVVESGKAVKATFWARLIRKARHGAQASGTEGSTPTPSRALAQNGCLRWNAKTFTPADKRASLETEAYFPRD